MANIDDLIVQLIKKSNQAAGITADNTLDVLKSIPETIEMSEVHSITTRNIITKPYLWGPNPDPTDDFEWSYFQWQ